MDVVFVATAGAIVCGLQSLRRVWVGRHGRAAAALHRGAVGASPVRPRPTQRLPFPFAYLNGRLQRGAVAISVRTVALLAAVGAVCGWALAYLLLGPGWLSDCAVCVGLWAPVAWVDHLAGQRRQRLALEMERAASALEGAVGAGLNAYEAMLEVGASAGGILGGELLRTVLDADRVGVSEALLLFQERLPLPEVRLLVAGIRLNQAAGAELSATLSGLGRTLRERRESVLALRSATAAGRWQANLLVAVPPLLLFFMRYAYPGFEAPLFGSAVGQLLLGTALLWLAVGYGVVRRMSTPKEAI